ASLGKHGHKRALQNRGFCGDYVKFPLHRRFFVDGRGGYWYDKTRKRKFLKETRKGLVEVWTSY
ncbi:MAG: hypothetical protein OSJ28_11355, partial [Desulfovibrio sp.]|nr:hypothetical protein [Desulfovibrio sp.]